MHDVQSVHVVESEAELLDNVGGSVFRERTLFLNHVEQITARNQLHDNVVASAIFHELKDASNVGVDRLLEHIQLVRVELLIDIGYLEAALFDDLNSAGHTRFLVLS